MWLSRDMTIPPRWDLRRAGWRMRHAAEAGAAPAHLPVLLDWRSGTRPRDWRRAQRRESLAAIGVAGAHDRARLLDSGLGDALDGATCWHELAARLTRLATRAASLPRRLAAGPVTLDLFHRDGRLGERWLGLHPREFALLWRLAETPGERVARGQLLRDVWRLEHLPPTNSLEVHVSRLRAKLHVARCGWLVETHPQGGYRLAAPRRPPGEGGHDPWRLATGLAGADGYQGGTHRANGPCGER